MQAQRATILVAPIGIEVGHHRQHARIVVVETVAMARVACAGRIRGVMRFDFVQAEEQPAIEFDAQRVQRGEIGACGLTAARIIQP